MGKRVLTDKQRSELRALRKQDPKRWTWRALAEHFGVSHGAVMRALDPEKRRAYDRAYYAANLEEERARSRAYRAANREKYCAESRARYEANQEKKRAEARARYEANQEKERAEARARRKTHKGRANSKKHGRLRRARKLDAPTGFVPTRVDALLLALQGGRCAACDKRLRRGHLDHVQPLSKGGAHALTNLLALCGSCNKSKNAAWPLSDWHDQQRAARLRQTHRAVRDALRAVFNSYATKVWPSEAGFKKGTSQAQRLEVERRTTELLLSLKGKPK